MKRAMLLAVAAALLIPGIASAGPVRPAPPGPDKQAAQSVLEDLMDSSHIVAHVKVLELSGGTFGSLTGADWTVRCRPIRGYKWAVKSRGAGDIFFGFRAHIGRDMKPIWESVPIEEGKEYIFFLRVGGARIRLGTESRYRPLYYLPNRKTAVQPYSDELAQILKEKRKRDDEQAQADYRKLCAIWRKTEPEEGQEKEAVTAEERKLLVRELDRTYGAWFAHDFRRMAAITLGNLEAKEAAAKLMSLLKEKEEEPMVSAEAARALGKIGDMKALGPLLDAVRDDRGCVRLHAAMGLRALDPNAEIVKPLATKNALGALLDALERLELPSPEPRRARSASGGTSGFWKFLEIDAVCTGLNLFPADSLTPEDRDRAGKMAAAILAVFPGWYFDHSQLQDTIRFCRTHQPELFAEKAGTAAAE